MNNVEKYAEKLESLIAVRAQLAEAIATKNLYEATQLRWDASKLKNDAAAICDAIYEECEKSRNDLEWNCLMTVYNSLQDRLEQYYVNIYADPK